MQILEHNTVVLTVYLTNKKFMDLEIILFVTRSILNATNKKKVECRVTRFIFRVSTLYHIVHICVYFETNISPLLLHNIISECHTTNCNNMNLRSI